MPREIAVEKLRRICDPQGLDCNTSADLKAAKAIIGQDRAARSLQFGLGIKASGFNVYVAGPPGTGRATMVGRFVEEIEILTGAKAAVINKGINWLRGGI